MENVDLRNKSYKQVLVENESGEARKNWFLYCVFLLIFFSIILFTFVNKVCPDQIQKSHMFNKKEL